MEESKNPKVRIADFEPIPPDVIATIPSSLIEKERVVPLKKHLGRLIVATYQLNGTLKPEGLAMVAGCPVDFVFATREEVEAFISRHYKSAPAPSSPPRRMIKVPPELIVPAAATAPAPAAPAPRLEEHFQPEPVAQPKLVEPTPEEQYSLIVGGVAPDLAEPEPKPVFDKTVVDEHPVTNGFSNGHGVAHDALDLEAPSAAFLELSNFANQQLSSSAFEEPVVEKEEAPVEESTPIAPAHEEQTAEPVPQSIETIEPKVEPMVEEPVKLEVIAPDPVVKPEPAIQARDPQMSSEFLSLVSAAVVDRASEVLLTVKGERIETRHRLRGTLVPMTNGKGTMGSLEIERLFDWIKSVGESQTAEGLEWYDVRKEVNIGPEVFSCHAFLTVGKRSKILTVRINSQKESLYSPSTWGMDPSQIKAFTEFLEKKQGFVLFAGSDREGITQNLHACARHLATPKKHVVAVEPYLESWMSDVDQFTSKGDPEVFTQFLKVAFKHAPDVAVVNPLEQKADFELSLIESLKGRLVLGRSYAADCADALVQLASLGVEPYLVSSAIIGVVAKRTLRLNCPVCQTKDPTARSQARELGIPEAMQPSCFYLSKGCETCSYTGFNGETDIFEILVMTPELRNVFNRDVKAETIRAHIKTSGLLTLRQVAVHKAINGQTSLAEVVRTTPK